jgi:hypothetical protein
MEIKTIPRVAYYFQPEKRKPRLQMSMPISHELKEEENVKERPQEIDCNYDPTRVEEGNEANLNGFRNFNQWTTAVNFNFCQFNSTYESITIDEDFEMN